MLPIVVYDQWGKAFTLPHPFEEYPPFFRLRHYLKIDGLPGQEVYINEPVEWDKIKTRLKRSAEWFSVSYEFTDAKTQVSFDGNSGRDFIKGIFLSEGEDATITLQTGIKIGPSSYIVLYEGRLNLSTYKQQNRTISVGLERKSLQSKIQARWDTAFALSPTLQTPLSPQTLAESLQVIADGRTVDMTLLGDTNRHVWFQFDTSNPKKAEIQEFAAGRPAGFSDSEGPVAGDEWLIKFRSSGTFDVDISLQYRVWFTIKKRQFAIGTVRVREVRLTTVLVLLRTNGTREEFPITIPQVLGNANQADVELNVPLGNLKKSLTVEKGDKLFLYGLLVFTHNRNELESTQIQFKTITTRISISGKSQNRVTSAESILLHDALNDLVRQATDLPDRFRSYYYGPAGSRYGVSGPGAERIITNGFAIRQFQMLEHPIKTSLADMLPSLQAIDGIGLEYAPLMENGEPVDVVRVRPITDFFRPVELLRLDKVGAYKEEVIASELYSTIDVGYQKYVDEGVSALEEVHTTHQLTTPIRNEEATKTLTSKLVASSVAIERTRREQFADTQRDGTEYDDQIFLIQCKPTPGYAGSVTFGPRSGQTLVATVTVPSVIPWLAAGMRLTVSGTQFNNRTYLVVSVAESGQKPWSFQIMIPATGYTPETAAVVSLKSTTPTGTSTQTYVPETGADLNSVTGLTDSATAYNLRLTPGRMVYATAPLWAGCLVDKDLTETVDKTKTPQNGALMTVIDGADPLRVAEGEGVPVGRLLPRLTTRPRTISFRVRLTRMEIQRLRLGCQGLLPIEQVNGEPVDPNYGYVSLLNEEGIRVAGWPDEVEWSHTDEDAVLTLRQAALDLGDTISGLDCTQFIGWTLEQALAADPQTRRRIELCTFRAIDPL